MSSPSKAEVYALVVGVLAELTEATEDYLDWASTPGDDECSPLIIERLCKAQQEARDLIEGLGHGQVFN